MKKRTAQDMKELRILAADIAEGKIFGFWQLPNPNLAFMVFMPLMFITDEETLKKLENQLIYEYIDKAGPRSINGMPIFTSFRYFPESDIENLNKLIKKYHRMVIDFKR